MNKWFCSMFAVVALCAAPQLAQAQFGGFGALKGGGGADLDGFLKSADDAEVLMRKSSWNLAEALLAKDKLDTLKEKREAIEKLTDPKEKEAKLREMDKDVNAELAKVDYAAKSKELESDADSKKKEKTASGVYNFSLGALKDAELLAQGQKLVTTPPSPANATKLPRLKNFVSSVSAQMDSIGKVASGLKQLSSSVGLKALPTKASDKPREIAD